MSTRRREWDSNPRHPFLDEAVFKTAAIVHSAIPPGEKCFRFACFHHTEIGGAEATNYQEDLLLALPVQS